MNGGDRREFFSAISYGWIETCFMRKNSIKEISKEIAWTSEKKVG